MPLTLGTPLDDLTLRARGLLPLPALTAESYATGHAAFERRSDQRTLLTAWLCRLLQARTGDLRVLSVGCGDGQLDARLAAAARTASGGRAVVYTGVDPHPASAGAFLSRVGAVCGVTASATVGRAESLPADGHDVVLAVHSLYYVSDLRATVARLREALRPGGVLVVALAPQGELNALAAALAPPVDGHRQWWAADLDDALATLDVDVEHHRIDAVVDLQACLDDDETAGAVLDFAVQAVVPAALRTAVLDHLVSVRLGDRGLQVAHPVDLRVVRSR